MASLLEVVGKTLRGTPSPLEEAVEKDFSQPAAVESTRPNNQSRWLRRRERELTRKALRAGLEVADLATRPVRRGFEIISEPFLRENFAIAGAVEAAVKGDENPLLRAKSEIMASEDAKRRSFVELLSDAVWKDIPIEARKVPIPTIWGQMEVDPTVFPGIAADIALAPSTYLSFGVGAAKKIPVIVDGKIIGGMRLNKQGLKVLNQEANKLLPEAKRYAEALKPKPDARLSRAESIAEIKRRTVEADLWADEIARQGAAVRVNDMLREGKALADKGGVKFFGKSAVPGETISAPLKNLGAFLNSKKPGAAVLNGTNKMVRALDGLFNETDRVARGIPGYEGIKVQWRDNLHNYLSDVRKSADDLTEGLDNVKIDAGLFPEWVPANERKMSTYIALHLDDPARFPIRNIPETYWPRVKKVQGLFQNWFAEEAALGIIDEVSYRQNYLTHIYKNSREEMEKISTLYQPNRPSGALGQFSSGPWDESRAFETITDAVEFTENLRQQGHIGFQLKPELDLRSVILKRGQGHSTGVAAQQFFNDVKSLFGRTSREFEIEQFRRFLPFIQDAETSALAIDSETQRFIGRMINADRGGRRGQVKRMLSKGVTRVGKVKPKPGIVPAGKAPKDIPVKSVFTFSPEAKAAFLVGRARATQSLPEFVKFVEDYKGAITEMDPGAIGKIRQQLNHERRSLAKSWGMFGEELVEVKSGDFAGWWLPRSILRDVERMDQKILRGNKDVHALLKTFDLFQDVHKVALTVPWPAFHNRNAYSNTGNMFTTIGLRALDPVSRTRTAAIMAGADGTVVTPLRRMTFEEVRQLAHEHGIFKDFGQLSEFRGKIIGRKLNGTQRALSKGLQKVIKTDKISGLTDQGFAVIENEARFTMFLKYLEDGFTPRQAEAMVKKVLFDYEALSPFEREFMSRLIPFYIWNKKNLAFTLDNLRTNPGRYGAIVRTFDPANRGPEAEALPDYLRGDIKVKFSHDGKTVYLTGIDLPFNSAMDQIWDGSTVETLQKNISMASPFLKILIETAGKRDLFTGRDLEGRTTLRGMGEVFRSMPKPVRDYFEFKEETRNGEPVYTVNALKAHIAMKGWALSRIYTTFDRLMREDVEVQRAVLDILVGLRTREIDMTELDEAILRNRVRQIEENLKKKGVLKEITITTGGGRGRR